MILCFDGNIIEISPGYCDSTINIDTFTRFEQLLITMSDPHPIKLNGNKIYYSDELTTKVIFQSKDSSLGEYLIEQIATDLAKLPDGHYYLDINNFVIDKKGKTVFYEFNGITINYYHINKQDSIQLDLKNEIDIRIKNTLNSMVLTPGQYQSTNVPSHHYIYGVDNPINIKDHKIVSSR